MYNKNKPCFLLDDVPSFSNRLIFSIDRKNFIFYLEWLDD